MEGKDGKTERATGKKRRKERQEGNVCVSPEITSMAVLFVGLLAFRLVVPIFRQKLGVLMQEVTRFQAVGDWTGEKIGGWFLDGCAFLGLMMAPLFIPVMLGAVAANVAQTGPYFSTKTLKWKLSSLSPVKGMKRLFSMQSFVKLGISILKIGLICFTVYFMVRKQIFLVVSLSNVSHVASVQWIFHLIFRMSLTIVIIFTVIAALDWCYKKWKHEKGLMMTKQEVKEERKQQEPSPLVKRAQVKKMREFSLMRMMAAVPKANVVITNPTHVAVAIEYDPERMNAPKLTAKGLRLVADRIRKIAEENNVPIIERPETARSLYKYVKVGHEIPSRFYEAVAEVMAYLYRIGRGMAPAA